MKKSAHDNGKRSRFFLTVAIWVIAFLCLAYQTAHSETITCKYPDTTTCNSFSSWPASNEWVALNQVSESDSDTGAGAPYDFVGSSACPGLYYAKKNGYIFFRVRLKGSGTIQGAHFIYIQGTPSNKEPEYGFALDTQQGDYQTHGLEAQKKAGDYTTWEGVTMDDVDSSNSKKCENDIDGSGSGGSCNYYARGEGYVRTVTDLEFPSGCSSTNLFMDFAIKCTYFTRVGSSVFPNLCTSSFYVLAASNKGSNDHAALSNSSNSDVGGGVAALSGSTAINDSHWTGGSATLVDLLDFQAESRNDKIVLTWKTASETDNAGFHLWRLVRGEDSSDYVRITDNLIPAKGSPTEGAKYTYKDKNVTEGSTYDYKLEDIDTEGVSTYHGPVSATAGYIHLLTPENGAEVKANETPPTFDWESSPFDRFAVQFSRHPDARSETLSLPLAKPKKDGKHRWTKETSYTPSAKEWRQITRLARKEGMVYWHVVGKGPYGNRIVSKANKLVIQP